MLNNCSRITRIIGIIMHYVHINYNKSLTSWSKTQVQSTCIPLWKNIVPFWSLMKWLYGGSETLLFGSHFSFLIRNQNWIHIQMLASFWSKKILKIIMIFFQLHLFITKKKVRLRLRIRVRNPHNDTDPSDPDPDHPHLEITYCTV